MPVVRNRRRTGVTNTRSGGPVRPTRRTVPAHTLALVPIVEAVTITPMEEEDIPNKGALQALKPENYLDQVSAFFLVNLKLLNSLHSFKA